MRTGLNATETVLTPANVNVASFGLLRTLTVDTTVDAQPLYLSRLDMNGVTHNVVYVATEGDSLYAFDADSGALLWRKSLLPAGEVASDDHACDTIDPSIGVTATPVIDRSAGKIFLVAMSKDTGGAYHQRLHAMDIVTGAEVAGSPAEITATYGGKTFDSSGHVERTALLLNGGTIYTTWSSHCDYEPYGGWIIAFDAATLTRSGVLDVAANSTGGPSIWMAGQGPGADAAGNVYLLTANGRFETTLDANGFPDEGDYGNAFLKISPARSGLKVIDYYSPMNTQEMSGADLDLGSGGEMLLPDQTDAGGVVRHLIIGAGKNGGITLVDRDSMGKFNPAKNNVWQESGSLLQGVVFASPAYFNGTVYYCDVRSTLKAIPVVQARLAASPSSTSATVFPYPGCTPTVSASGTANAIVWAYENQKEAAAVLHAYDAGNLGNELYNSNQAAGGRDQFGLGNKFIAPAVADGKVFLGTPNAVAVFGLLH